MRLFQNFQELQNFQEQRVARRGETKQEEKMN
jgi:hypothetical protein